MKALKIIAALAFIIGFLMVAGAIGTDDFYTMELHQPHVFQIWRAIAGIMLMIPVVLIGKANSHD